MTDPIWTTVKADGTATEVSGNAASTDGAGGSTASAFRAWQLPQGVDPETTFESLLGQLLTQGAILNFVDCRIYGASGTKVVQGGWPAGLSVSVDADAQGLGEKARLGLTLGPGDKTKFGRPSTELTINNCSQSFADSIRSHK